MKRQKLNTKNVLFLILLFAFSFLIFNFEKVFAQSSSNDNYNIDIQDIDTNLQNSPPPVTPIPQTIEENVPTVTPESSTNYSVDNSFLTFSVDNDFVDYGSLTPENPIARSITLSIKANNPYSVQIFEDHPPSSSVGLIPNTTCDDGQCTQTNESAWTNNFTYGFGLRCDNLEGLDCQGSQNGDYFRQPPDASRQQDLTDIASGLGPDQEKKAQVSLKINTSGTQKPGSYANNITFIAVPNF